MLDYGFWRARPRDGQTRQMFLEANSNTGVYRGVDFRPGLQEVIRPNAQSDIRNAFVVGCKANVQF